MRGASKPFKVRFTHVPQDGLTPIWDDAAKKWGFVHKPSTDLVNSSASKLDSIYTRSDNAFVKAEAAASAATSAQQTADSKATAAEAVAAVKDSFIKLTTLDGHVSSAAVIEFRQVDEYSFQVFIHPQGIKPGNPTATYQKWLDYVGIGAFNDLYDRVSAIEARLGIQ